MLLLHFVCGVLEYASCIPLVKPVIDLYEISINSIIANFALYL